MSEPAVSVQIVDATPALAPRRSHELVRAVAPASQAVAVAAGGFIAGAAVVGLTARRRARRPAARTPGRRSRRARGPAGELVRILGTRSLLLDIHLLDAR